MGLGSSVKVMLKSSYDADEDGAVDETEGVKSVEDLPSSPVKGGLVEKSGKLYLAVDS